MRIFDALNLSARSAIRKQFALKCTVIPGYSQV
jgi:hypothetical protein